MLKTLSFISISSIAISALKALPKWHQWKWHQRNWKPSLKLPIHGDIDPSYFCDCLIGFFFLKNSFLSVILVPVKIWKIEKFFEKFRVPVHGLPYSWKGASPRLPPDGTPTEVATVPRVKCSISPLDGVQWTAPGRTGGLWILQISLRPVLLLLIESISNNGNKNEMISNCMKDIKLRISSW